jgi:drug/metabolite transporter (DMT)-like permease
VSTDAGEVHPALSPLLTSRADAGVCDACRVLFGRARRFFNDRTMIGFICAVVVGIALVVFLIVSDTTLVIRAYEQSDSSIRPALATGAAAALGSVLAVVWYRRRVGHLGGTARRMLGWVGIAWAASFVVAFVWTHPKGRDDELATPLEAGVVSYVLVIVVVAAAGFVPIAVFRPARRKTHQPRDRGSSHVNP